MNILEFNSLRLMDPVYDTRGKLTKAYDIDRTRRTVKTGLGGSGWRDFREVKLPNGRRKTGQRL